MFILNKLRGVNSLKFFLSLLFCLVLSTLVFMLFLFQHDYGYEVQQCTKNPCLEVNILNNLNPSSSRITQKSLSSIDYPQSSQKIDSEIRVCVVILGTNANEERYSDMTITVNGVLFYYDILYVYAKNDKTKDDSFIIDLKIGYRELLLKVWPAFEYVKNQNCNFYIKTDEDMEINFIKLSKILMEQSSNAYIGSEWKSASVVKSKTFKNYDLVYEKVTGRKRTTYYNYMSGVFYVLGSDLFQCIIKKVKLFEEKGFFDLPNEDTAVGFLTHFCRREVVNLAHLFYGTWFNSLSNMDMNEGLLVVHMKH